ncbi:shikimate dehydrogenase [Lysobacter pythonis]|uniref:Shikimate dehydrogenase (NADP(+)) n=1 Tax=Solilutibacter pythonis TaxID=2483112 RepID=A0A3M2I188_9GAMM|nr:shikimate dehydrogenase [Lysobacter pythonis]RMH93730.1 shikimate dehydrogenase [Lysobacter pythonis]
MGLPHYAVLGHPVAHSLSPRIHAAFGRQCGVPLTYLAIDTAKAGFAITLERFAAAGGIGANVTAPDKAEAAARCDQLGHRARKAGVVNTLSLRDGRWEGDNTDGAGLVRDLRERRGLDLHDQRALLIGAGGAAHGVAPALMEAGLAQLVIANRTRHRAYDLLDRLYDPARLRACTLAELPGMGEFDLIVQATSAGHDDQLPPLPASLIGAASTCVDLNYGRAALPFLAWARAHHCANAIDGLGMLVEQAAEAFQLWHGMRPDTDPVYTQLRLSTGGPEMATATGREH